MNHEFTVAELYAAHRALLGDDDARTLAEGLGADGHSASDAVPSPPVMIFALSLALLACLADETAAKVERLRARANRLPGGPQLPDATWQSLLVQTRAWRDAGFPPELAPKLDSAE